MTSRYGNSLHPLTAKTQTFRRLDRLLILLDTGSSSSVRTTAAKQLAQLAAKSVRSDVGGDDEVGKHRLHAALIDASAWAELMSVVARVRVCVSFHTCITLMFS